MNQRLLLLFEKYFESTATHEELVELTALLDEERESGISEWLEKEWNDISGSTEVFDHEESETMLTQIISRRPGKARVVSLYKRNWFRAVAAAVVVMMIAGAIWWQNNAPQAPQTVKNQQQQDNTIVPGSSKAVLTLADGSQITLDDVADGNIATQANTVVVKRDGQILYQDGGKPGEVMFNTISTPRGGMYMLELTDGSKVWLNSSSSIRYPNRFAGTERKVEISGEAYFEVAKNTKMPFRVSLNNQAEVEVLGTHFNVSAYENEENVHTTLLEGSVRVMSFQTVSSNRPAVTLKPGQQAQIVQALAGQEDELNNENPQIKVVNDADIDKVMAWKNGAFNFNDASLKEVMKQFERWYDIEVIYESTVPDIKLRGEMTRGVTLNELLKNLGKMGLHYKLEGRKLVVLP